MFDKYICDIAEYTDEYIDNECFKLSFKYPNILNNLKKYELEYQTYIYNLLKSFVQNNSDYINADKNGFGYDNNNGCCVRFVDKNSVDFGGNDIVKYNHFYNIYYQDYMTLSIMDKDMNIIKSSTVDIIGKSDEHIINILISELENLSQYNNKVG